MMFKTAAILAGGHSSRMGRDKQLLDMGSGPLRRINISKLKTVFDDVVVVTNTPELYEGEGVRTISDEIPGLGPLSGMHAALGSAESRYVFFFACDMPELNVEYVRYLMKRINGLPDTGVSGDDTENNTENITGSRNLPDIVRTVIKGRPETFYSFVSVTVRPEIEKELLDEASGHSVNRLLGRPDLSRLEITEDEAARFDPELGMFRNINTPKELEEYIHRLEK